MSATDLEERTELKPTDGDDKPLAHIIAETDWEKGYIFGEEVVALCGYKWVPTKDVKGCRMCSVCKEIYEADANAFFGNGAPDDLY